MCRKATLKDAPQLRNETMQRVGAAVMGASDSNTEEKFVSRAAPPTDFQREAIEILIEECSEVIQRATKLLRFGPLEIQPGQPLDNVERMSLEVGDVLETLELVRGVGLLSGNTVTEGRDNKRLQLKKFLQHGTL